MTKTTVSVREAAKCWGISWQRVYQQIEKGHLPKPDKGGGWPWPKINIAYIEHVRQVAEGDNPTITRERQRLLKAQANKAELDYAERANQLVAVEPLQRELEKLFLQVRNSLMYLPRKLPPELVGRTAPEIMTIMDREIREILTNLAHGAEKIKGESSSAKTKLKSEKRRKKKCLTTKA